MNSIRVGVLDHVGWFQGAGLRDRYLGYYLYRDPYHYFDNFSLAYFIKLCYIRLCSVAVDMLNGTNDVVENYLPYGQPGFMFSVALATLASVSLNDIAARRMQHSHKADG